MYIYIYIYLNIKTQKQNMRMKRQQILIFDHALTCNSQLYIYIYEYIFVVFFESVPEVWPTLLPIIYPWGITPAAKRIRGSYNIYIYIYYKDNYVLSLYTYVDYVRTQIPTSSYVHFPDY